MKEITFTCEIVTPKLVNITAPEIKGLIRFWWKKLYEDSLEPGSESINIQEMLNKESKIFGGEDYKGTLYISILDNKISTESKPQLFIDSLNSSLISREHRIKNENGTLKVKLSSNDENNLIEVANTFIQLSLLDTLGSSKKGEGNFRIIDIKSTETELINNLKPLIALQNQEGKK